ncbi:hypothetical protein TWF730_006773 [Orbilia blumenaviensis]|uniref:Small RNA 2'-O-methyltransferase n=1 Tax=Orbilia blumenaviensis TaxID=1796055 RepID=A0AAV9VIQ0_9PEZI
MSEIPAASGDSTDTNNGSGSTSSSAVSHISYGIPSPPSTPPRIKFTPPLFIQRRVKVFSLLKEISRNYEAPIQSLLEVGCGSNTPFVQRLLSCDDELPLSLLSGIDVDDELISTGPETAFTTVEYGGDDRWRDLTVSLVHGSFEDISLNTIGPYDAITSCEVIEHLDPGPLANFAPVLLGRMNPKVLVVTTPNRDFNSLFEMSFESLEDVKGKKPYIWDPQDDPEVATKRFYREPHTYAMRHHDHRFEWTRQEFQTWGDDAAETFGYQVSYHGCGALQDGAEIRATRWRVEEALRQQIKNKNITAAEGQSLGSALLLEAFGHCSQVAVFIRNDFRKKSEEQISSPGNRYYTNELTPMDAIVENHIQHIRQLPPQLQLIKYHTFPKTTISRAYPPAIFDIFDQQRLTIKHLLPVEVQRVWQYAQTLREYKEYDYEAVVINTDAKCLWDSCYTIRRACRFHFEVLEYLMGINNKDSFNTAGKQSDEGLLEFDIIENPANKENPVGVVTIELEPIREYASTQDANEVPNFEDSEDDDISSKTSSSLKVISETPKITAKILWHTNPSERTPVCEKTYVTQGLLADIPKDKILTTDGTVETMGQFKRQKKEPQFFQPPVLTSIPVTLVFLRPEKNEEEAVEEFDYEKQKTEMFDSFGGNMDMDEDWSEGSRPTWDADSDFTWDDAGAEPVSWD